MGKGMNTNDDKEARALNALANRINELDAYWAKSPDGSEWQMFTITVSPTERNRILAALRRCAASEQVP